MANPFTSVASYIASFVRPPPNNTGPFVRTVQLLDTDGNLKEQQVILIGSPTDAGLLVTPVVVGQTVALPVSIQETAAVTEIKELLLLILQELRTQRGSNLFNEPS